MNFIRNRNFRAGPQTSLEGFICPQNSDKQQKIKVFGRSVGGQKRVVNFDVLRQLLGDNAVEDAPEAYEFNWVGKQAARAEVLQV